METLLSLQKYAAKNRLSLHAVIKKTMSGELPTVVKTEDGKEVTYICLPSSELPTSNHVIKEGGMREEETMDYEKAYKALHENYVILKTKYEVLVKKGKDQ